MAEKSLKNLRISFALVAMVVIPATVFAQGVERGRNLAFARATPLTSSAQAHAATQHAKATDATAYDYTLIAYPGTLDTQGVGINPGALQWKDEMPGVVVVGAEAFPDGMSQTGFRVLVSKTDGVTEDYKLLNDPDAPTPQQAYSVNDLGQVVGDYIDQGVFHSYQLYCGKFKTFDVPFAGATGTYSPAINNAGEIVGSWNDSAGNAHGYTLIDGKYVSFDYPGAAQAQFYYGINSEGNITGSYADSSGNIHGFLRKGKSYTSIDYPGAVYTAATGINDAGEIVGGYCMNNQCNETGEGELGFLLRDGVYSSFTIPGEFAVALESINDQGVVMGNYVDAAGLLYTFLGSPKK